MASSILLRSLRNQTSPHRNLSHYYSTTRRCITTKTPPQKTQPKPSNNSKNSNHEPKKTSWLTRKVEESPTWRSFFFRFTNLIGYGSPKQLAGRRAFILYEKICAVKPDEDRAFWQDGEFFFIFTIKKRVCQCLACSYTILFIYIVCLLPPTFQSWFTVTNLHIWMLTVRLRALPAEHGKHYQQALIDHFFIDIEDRIRAVLQPSLKPADPYTFATTFYSNPNAPSDSNTTTPTSSEDGKQRQKRLSRAPDRIVTQQMKIFKEQWAGMGLSLDLGLVKGDMELAGAIWRNLLGARGAQGIAYPNTSSASTSTSTTHFRRSVNLVGGEVVNVSKVDIEKEEAKDDGSGVHDFAPEEADRYLDYPEVMLDVVEYLRREIDRLDKVSDESIINGDLMELGFGRVRVK